MSNDCDIPIEVFDEIERALEQGEPRVIREAIAKYGMRVLATDPPEPYRCCPYDCAKLDCADLNPTPFRTLMEAGIRGDEAVGSPYSSTMLHDTVRWAPELVRQLLALGANPNVRNGCGETPLMVAARSYTFGGVAREQSPLSVRYLLDAGADSSLRGPGGKTALELALEQLSLVPEVIQLLRDSAGSRRGGE